MLHSPVITVSAEVDDLIKQRAERMTGGTLTVAEADAWFSEECRRLAASLAWQEWSQQQGDAARAATAAKEQAINSEVTVA